MTLMATASAVQLCCERYEQMDSLLLQEGKLCDNEPCIYVLENIEENNSLVYSPRYCKIHAHFYCECCYTAARNHTTIQQHNQNTHRE